MAYQVANRRGGNKIESTPRQLKTLRMVPNAAMSDARHKYGSEPWHKAAATLNNAQLGLQDKSRACWLSVGCYLTYLTSGV